MVRAKDSRAGDHTPEPWRDVAAAWLVHRGLRLATHTTRARMMHVISDEWRHAVGARLGDALPGNAKRLTVPAHVCTRCAAGAHGERVDVHRPGQVPCEHVVTGEDGAGCRPSR